MYRNFFITAWRNLLRNRVYSAINIFGLAVGLAVALTIGLWVYYEYSFDRFLPGHENVYQVHRNFDSNGEILNFKTVSLKLADALRTVPEIENVVAASWVNQHGLKVGEKKLFFNGASVDDGFLEMFRYPLLKGTAASVLKDPYSIVICESVARAFFGDEDPINKTIRYDNLHDLKVTGLLKDIPANSTLQFNFVIPMAYLDQTVERMKRQREQFSQNGWQEFVQLKKGVTLKQVEPKIKFITRTEKSENAQRSTVILHPVSRWHLYGKFNNGIDSGGFIEYIKMFSIIALLVLLIACINFINLSTARSEKRAREVGVRKAIGSLRRDLVVQFLLESFLLTLLSFLLAMVFLGLGLPLFNQLTGRTVEIPWTSLGFWIGMLLLVLLTSLAAGSRPALFLSAFQPVKVLKGKLTPGKSGTLPRKVLVVVQFSCSIILIISTIIIYQQIQHVKDRPTGFDRNRMLMTNLNGDLEKNFIPLKNELLSNGIITGMTTASSPATNVYWHSDVEFWPGKFPGENIEMGTVRITKDYFTTMGMRFKEGHDFTSQYDTLKVIFNHAAVKQMRIENPVGKHVNWQGADLEIIGITEDALLASPFDVAEPMMFLTQPEIQGSMMYRLSSTINTEKAIVALTAAFTRFNPSFAYDYSFADRSYADKFNMELMIGKLSAIFALLAIMISCLGLFGLAAYMSEQRNKEIGIRKVLGASVTQVWMLLSRDFMVLVLVSCMIAIPLANYFLGNWLETYSYRIEIGPGVFLLSSGLALLITLITVSYQSLKAAIANPVNSLKSE